MIEDASYHRSFRVFAKGLEALTDGLSVEDGKGDGVSAYRIVNNNIVPLVAFKKQAQNFEKYSTSWERMFSTLCNGERRANPIVDDDMNVVGHYGWFRGDQIYLQPKSGNNHISSKGPLNTLLQHGVIALTQSHHKLGSTSFGVSDQSYRLITDIEGRILISTDYRNRDGAVATWVTPLDLFIMGKLATSLLGLAGKGVIRLLARREAAREANVVVNLAKEALAQGKLTLSEMDDLLAGLIRKHKELQMLIAARGLKGEALLKATQEALRTWERAHGRSVKFVEQGIVQKLTARGNFASHQGQVLMVEKQLLKDPQLFYTEMVHELSASSLKVSGQAIGASELAFVGRTFSKHNNALFLLENAISRKDGLQGVMKFAADFAQ